MGRRLAGVGAAALLLGTLAQGAGATSASIPVIADANLGANFTTVGGAAALPTTKTVSHFWSSTLDPNNGVTYGYNMVGANPATCTGSACSTTVTTDITPLTVVVDGVSFAGSDVVAPTLASPVFSTNDYGSTPAATTAGAFPNSPRLVEGPGGSLLPGDSGVSLQLEDATMRAQFNREGSSSPYHLMLNPVVEPAVTIVVPQNQGTLLQSGRGVVFADVNYSWWGAQIKNLTTKADPTHLPLYLTNDVMLFQGHNPANCCVIGFHGATSSAHGNGNQSVQTFAWASWVQPGLYSRASGGTDWALQDIHALSHEISEWADDPFANNAVEPWLTPTAPQYGCTAILETGDPVVAIGFAMGTNTFEQGPNPNGSQSADGYYHPEDEVFAPWFLRQNPSTAADGRYTLMGSLNPFTGFAQPATGC